MMFQEAFAKRAQEYGLTSEEGSILAKKAMDTAAVMPGDWLRHGLDAALTHKTTGALLGGVLGAGGAALASKPGKRHRNALLGALAGASGGYAASSEFPADSKALNETLVKHLIRQPVGKVVTNLTSPWGYELHSKLDRIKKMGPVEIAHHIQDDVPLPSNPAAPESNAAADTLRDNLFRRLFDLPTRGEGKDAFIPRADGTLALNKTHPLITDDNDDVTGGLLRQIVTATPGAGINPNKGDLSKWVGTMVFSNLHRPVNPDGSMSIDDRWDLGMEPGESVSKGLKVDPVNLARYLMDKITNPPTVKDDIPAALVKAYGGK